MTRRSLVYCGVSAAVLAFTAQSAWAQAAAPSATAHGRDSAAAEATTLQELVVTAQKREQNLNDVGMSVQATSGDRLIQLGVTDTSDLQKIVRASSRRPPTTAPTSIRSAALASRTRRWRAARRSASIWTRRRCRSRR